jgi:hypothetical protein
MTGSDTRADDVGPSTRRESAYGSILPEALRISSVSDVVALLGLLGGCLYFYNRAYNVVFLASFGLGVGVVPMSLQDAMVDGLESAVIHILYLWVPIATAFLLYSFWVIANRFFEPEKRTLVPTDMPAPATWWTRVQGDITVKTSFTLLVAILTAPVVLLFSVGLIAVPAELAAERDVAALRVFVAGDCVKCASYELGTKTIVGRPVASTTDRLFVLGRDERVVPIRLDDLRAIAVARRR